jgi:hypothetical protein
MSGNSLESLVSWLTEKSRLLGWDAILVLDRSKLNHFLIQEYISRFNSTSYMPPITASKQVVPTQREFLYNYSLDYPRLSFESADLHDATANLTLRVVGGVLATMEMTQGVERAIKVDVADPLDGPIVSMKLNLADVLGDVDKDGRVLLDLAKGGEIRVDYSTSEFMQIKLGDLMQSEFDKLTPEQRLFTLNTLKPGSNEYLRPVNFHVRTQASGPAARHRASDEYGNGAVVMFLTMKNGQAGRFPGTGSDFRYLIPDDTGREYSATVLLSTPMVANSLIGPAFSKFAREYGLSVVQSWEPGFIQLSLSEGVIKTPPGVISSPDVSAPWTFKHDGISIASDCFRISMFYTYVGMTINSFSGRQTVWGNYWEEFGGYLAGAELSLGIGGPLVFIDGRSGLTLVGAQSGRGDVKEFLGMAGSMPGFSDVIIPPALEAASALMAPLYSLYSSNEEFEASFRDSIQLPFGQGLHFLDIKAPYDIAMFGAVSPATTAFEITPAEVIIGQGASYAFTTVPEVKDLQWTVEPTATGSDNVGKITSAGVYTAPTSENIKGMYVRVRVNATDAKGYSSAALLSVVVRDITVNPVIQSCDFGASRDLTAGTLGGGALEWRLAGAQPGSALTPNGHARNGHTYKAGPQNIENPLVLEEIKVTNKLTNKSQSAYVLIANKDMGIAVSVDAKAGLPVGQMKLQGTINGTLYDGCKWEVLMGSGTVAPDSNIFTEEVAGQYPFAIITATVNHPVLGTFVGYMIQPLPLQTFSALHGPRESK